MGHFCVLLHQHEHFVVEAKAAEVVEAGGGAVENTHDDAFAVEGGQSGNAEVNFATEGLDLDAAVLRQAALRDVELGHQLETRDDGGLHFFGRRFLILQNTVDTEADAEFFFEGLDVNVA